MNTSTCHLSHVSTRSSLPQGSAPPCSSTPSIILALPALSPQQERATKISHGNTARLATYYGDAPLAKLCGIIASDEGRHEQAYQAIVEQFFQRWAWSLGLGKGGHGAVTMP